MRLDRGMARVLGRRDARDRREGRKEDRRVPLIERGRFDVALMAILKDEARRIEEWLCHHLAIGVDHFFLYDNGSTDDLHDVLKPYADHGIVTTVYFPMRGLQRDANNHVIRFFGSTTEWLAYADIDEFLVPERDEPIGQVLARFADAQQVLVSRREFCYGGHREPPGGMVTEAYRGYSVDVPRVGTSAVLAKPIVRPAAVLRVGIHNATTVDGRTVNTAGQPTSEEATAIEDPSYANLQMNHYYTKSWQEFQAKRNRATTSTHAFQLPDVPFDIPSYDDHAIDRWIPRTKALLEEMGTLARSPSRYGSRLRLTGFPSSDMFGQEATAVVTNAAAGMTEARKRKTARSLPMPGVRGAMARGEDHGYVPSVGAFLASPHVAQEVAWLQAEVTWALPDGQPPLVVTGGRVAASTTGKRAASSAAGGHAAGGQAASSTAGGQAAASTAGGQAAAWAAGEPLAIEVADAACELTIPAGGHPLRCHALLFCLRLERPGAAAVASTLPIGVAISAREEGEWRMAAGFEMPGAGTYLGLVALEKKPRSIDAVRISFTGATRIVAYDLALLTFG